jgi:hypothetical protein
MWIDELRHYIKPPFDTEASVFVAFNATAELQCFVELGWPMPRHVVDLWVEYRAITNGKRRRKDQTRLIDALTYYGCDHIGAVEKSEMQQLAMRGPPYTEAEKQALLEYRRSRFPESGSPTGFTARHTTRQRVAGVRGAADRVPHRQCRKRTGGCRALPLCAVLHCETDVDALLDLLIKMEPDLKTFHPQEMLFRGRSMVAQTRSDRVGIPVDMPLIHAITEHREAIRLALIAQYEHDHRWEIFEDGVFRMERYATWLRRQHIRLPPTGKSDTRCLSGCLNFPVLANILKI